MPFDQRSLIHREVWFPGGPRIPKSQIFLKNRKKSSKMQKLKNIQRYAKISDTPFDQRSLIHREAWFPPCFVRQNQHKQNFFLRGDFRQFPNKNVQMLDTSGSGGKKTFKRYLKSEQTHRHTDTQTHRQTDGHFDLQKASVQRADALKIN